MISRTDARPSVHSTLMISSSNGVSLIRLLTATSASATKTKYEVIFPKSVVECQAVFLVRRFSEVQRAWAFGLFQDWELLGTRWSQWARSAGWLKRSCSEMSTKHPVGPPERRLLFVPPMNRGDATR